MIVQLNALSFPFRSPAPVIIPLKILVTAVFIGLTLFGLLTLTLTKLDFFKREPMEIYDRKLIEDSTASNSLVDHTHCNELLDRHLKSSRRFTATKNYLQRGRLLRKRDAVGPADSVATGGRIRRRTKHYEFHSELTSSGGELQSSTYEEYRHLEEAVDEADEEDSNLEDNASEDEDETESEEETSESESDADSEEESSGDPSSDQSSEQTGSGSQTIEESSAYQESDRTDQSSSDKRPSQLVYEQQMNKTERVVYERPPPRNLTARGQPVNSLTNVNTLPVNRQQRPNTNKYNEKQYDKFHYRRNNQNYAFYRDENYHEPTCPLYSSHRALVSRK